MATASAAAQSEIRFGPFEVSKQVFHTSHTCYALVNLKPLLPGHVLVVPHRVVARVTDLRADELGDLMGTVQRVQRMLAGVYFGDGGGGGGGGGGRAGAVDDSSSSSSSLSLPWQGVEREQEADGTRATGGTSELRDDASTTSPAAAAVPAISLLDRGGFNIAIQDGVDAGQTVPHVHCHVIPRRRDATTVRGDEVYDLLQSEAGNVGGGLWDREHAAEAPSKRPEQLGKFPKIEDSERRPRTEEDMAREAAYYRARMDAMG